MPVTSMLRRIVVVAALIAAAAACSGDDQPTLTGAQVEGDAAEGEAAGDTVEVDTSVDPGIADDKASTECADLGTGVPEFEAAFCDYQAAALAAVAGPEGASAVEPALLAAGDEAIALVAEDPDAAIAMLVDATAALG